MNTESSGAPKPISEAKLNANRQNGRLTHGPNDPSLTRFNARKDGLTAGLTCLGLDTPENHKAIRLICARLGPRNALEAGFMNRLLWLRLQEGHFLDVERTVLTRKPPSLDPDDRRLFPFLEDPSGLKTLEHLARQLAHFTKLTHEEIQELLQVRKENWANHSQEASPLGQDTTGTFMAQATQSAQVDVSSCNLPWTLEACVADTRLILEGENPKAYEILARETWRTLRPANILEGFTAVDLVHGRWRLVRMMPITNILFERCALSASTVDSSRIGLAFVNDSQHRQAMASLRLYEAALHARIKKRLALFRKIRKQGWEDCDIPPAACSPADTLAGEQVTSASQPDK
jgi:hypothetical protein